MGELKDFQWEIIKNSLEKIDKLHKIADKTETDVALLKSAIIGIDGSIGISEQVKTQNKEINNLREDLKTRVCVTDCKLIHKNIAVKKKSALEWVKFMIPVCIAIASVIISTIK